MVIKGDGIGPELIESALDVLQAVEKAVGGF
jgi:isocitrate/isopropylmalate dehydrogenase